MVPVIGEMRAYFGPVDRNASTPTPFDAVKDGGFDLGSPPAGWTALGSISGFKRANATKYAAIRTGVQQEVELQVRNEADATLDFEFREWGKLQLALASGTSQFNLLAGASFALAGGSTADTLKLDAASAATFAVGDWVVVDEDYNGSTGFVGAGSPGTYVSVTQSQSLTADFLRRVSMNVARVASIRETAVQLETPLLAGIPGSRMKLQKVMGFADREGASFFQEWSGLFVAESASGGRVCFYYPRLQPAMTTSESMHRLTESLGQIGIPVRLRALAVADAEDGESVLCYRVFLPNQL